MKLIPDRLNHTKAAILSVIKSIVSLFILFRRMSKCQKNKYFNVGSQPCKTANPEFQGSLSKLLADREKQDFALSSSQSQVKVQAPNDVPSKAVPSKAVPSKAVPSKANDIDTILGKF
jgi:hypothetical protein